MQSMMGGGQDYNSIQFQLDSRDELNELKAELLGLEWSEEQQDYIKSDRRMPMINEHGANILMTFLKPRVNKMISLSNHSEEDIDKRCLQYINDISILLVRHRQDFNIMSFAVCDNIIDLCDDIFRATALKSINGWEGDGIRKQQSYVESKETVIDNTKKNTSPFTFPFNFNKSKG